MKISTFIMGVVGVGVIVTILIPTGGCGQSKETSVTKVEMSQACVALIMYEREYNQLLKETDNARLVQILEGDNPKKLKFYILDRERSKTGEFIDGWDKPLIFKPNATGFLMRSAGKDGLYYTKDDITQEAQVRASITPLIPKQ